MLGQVANDFSFVQSHQEHDHQLPSEGLSRVRAPFLAKCDRNRVLTFWAPHCGNVAPSEFQIEFSSVHARQFVEKLSKELRVFGVVAAAGDASKLLRLCEEYVMRASIINSAMDKNKELGNMDSSDLKDRAHTSSQFVYELSSYELAIIVESKAMEHPFVGMLKKLFMLEAFHLKGWDGEFG
ncbi:hypothetical protein GH714_036947 [Hevea brasiliensis]|uniref:Uncharacterized protein n=1 Tax=Hevea brasiliensis TaxID=3981 RepID=A0A6A6NF66_HEVBR|nr:hypothetical protein GH714_036947 [Hevea brasiliensis]